MYQYPKEFLPVDQLLQKLASSGLIISSLDEARIALTNIGYYRLKGYGLQWFDPISKKYISNITFSDILKLYYFDSEMSHLLFNYLSQIEISLKARLVNALQITHDALILHDPSIFKNKQLYWKNQSTIASEISRSNDVFIEHNFNTYEGAIPLWACVEVMSFGTISKIIKNLKTGRDSAFSVLIQNYKFQNNKGLMVTPSKDMFTSWIQTASIIRNICAHNSRIYNRTITTRPQLILSDAIIPPPRYYGLYQIILSMKYLRPTDSSWLLFVDDFKRLLIKYSGIYDINQMNFPHDWEQHFNI